MRTGRYLFDPTANMCPVYNGSWKLGCIHVRARNDAFTAHSARL